MSVCVTNFIKDCNEKEPWNKFQEFGVVVDVYIARNISKIGRSFALTLFNVWNG